jgi:hypothetical protein
MEKVGWCVSKNNAIEVMVAKLPPGVPGTARFGILYNL